MSINLFQQVTNKILTHLSPLSLNYSSTSTLASIKWYFTLYIPTPSTPYLNISNRQVAQEVTFFVATPRLLKIPEATELFQEEKSTEKSRDSRVSQRRRAEAHAVASLMSVFTAPNVGRLDVLFHGKWGEMEYIFRDFSWSVRCNLDFFKRKRNTKRQFK